MFELLLLNLKYISMPAYSIGVDYVIVTDIDRLRAGAVKVSSILRIIS